MTLSVPVTPHTFRNFCVMHMAYNAIPLQVLQSLKGSKLISSTEVYTMELTLDVATRHSVHFQKRRLMRWLC
ncbi:tyrosine-type recombinase/integrase [Salmonella enterica]|nr:phage integrase family protein [Salmonella enterica]EFT3536463.1 phage integrase family protein [Salmonella enterica]EFT8309444.1 phage integrase family protein [Salmonella enterica]EFT8385987.1 phage integrase family protein [Salmonella enterica]EHW8945070.1 tyrosine-type recombinase/integrase [Salmonella enterica]